MIAPTVPKMLKLDYILIVCGLVFKSGYSVKYAAFSGIFFPTTEQCLTQQFYFCDWMDSHLWSLTFRGPWFITVFYMPYISSAIVRKLATLFHCLHGMLMPLLRSERRRNLKTSIWKLILPSYWLPQNCWVQYKCFISFRVTEKNQTLHFQTASDCTVQKP